MKQPSNLSFSFLFDEYAHAEKSLLSYTRKHPFMVLTAAAGIGFAFGYFGVLRVLRTSMAFGLKEKILLKDFFEPANKNLSKPEEIDGPRAQA